MPNGRVEEIEAWETEGGVLHWGRESGPELDRFREEIRKAYGGRAPRVLDPFAGGGAIPLEAMRLGCEVTAADLNPVAWFILKCTLEYPQKLAGQKRRLPDFALADDEFMTAYLKAKGLTPGQIKVQLRQLRAGQAVAWPVPALESASRGENLSLLDHPTLDPDELQADLAWHVRAWGRWVLKAARRDLARFYPTYAEYCTLKPYRRVPLDTGEPLKFIPVNEAGEPLIDLLNTGFDAEYLDNPAQPRWVAKPVNLSRASTSGLEFEIKGRGAELLPSLFAPTTALNLRASLSFYDSKVKDIPGPDNRLEQQQPWSLNLGADYRLKSLPLSLGASLAFTPSYEVQQSDLTRLETGRARTLDAFALWNLSKTDSLRFSIQNLAPVAGTSTTRIRGGDYNFSERRPNSWYALNWEHKF